MEEQHGDRTMNDNDNNSNDDDANPSNIMNKNDNGRKRGEESNRVREHYHTTKKSKHDDTSKQQQTKKTKKHNTRKHHRRSDVSASSSSSSSDDSSSSSDSESYSRDRVNRRRTEKKKRKRKTRHDEDDNNDEKRSSSKKRPSKSIDDDDDTNKKKNKHHDVVTVDYTKNTEERKQRRVMARAALIETKFGYTADSNPFNDPNLVETFVWNKKKQREDSQKQSKKSDTATETKNKKKTNSLLLIDEIDKVRERRQNREEQKMEMERIKAEESRMKEYEHYDQFQQKEELFHLQQQKLRSAIRLIHHREKPIDIFAKHIILFGGLSSSESDSTSSSADHTTSVTKYQEQYNVMDIAMDTLDFEIEEPYLLLKSLTLTELQDLLIDIDAFRTLEREAAVATTRDTTSKNPNNNHAILLQYWDNLYIVTMDEIKYLQQQQHSSTNSTVGTNNANEKVHSKMVEEISSIFVDQSISDVIKMKVEIATKLHQQQQKEQQHDVDTSYDIPYWTFVHEQIMVYIAKYELSHLHSKMLTRQLQRLEQKKLDLLAAASTSTITNHATPRIGPDDNETNGPDPNHHDTHGDPSSLVSWTIPANVPADMLDDLEEELGLTNEVAVTATRSGSTLGRNNDDQYRSRKPRYYNRVKSGYDWSKYNQTHYDRDNPPPKIVQGYKFNIFYPDLINPMNTPQYKLEPVVIDGVVSSEYCIIRFHAGPPYEDIAFQIVNREWNRSRKRGFKCTFERGVLSLYFNFTTHWYRK